MRFDQDAYWGLGIGASITGRRLHGRATGRFSARRTYHRRPDAIALLHLHVFMIPGLLLAFYRLYPLAGAIEGNQRVPKAGKPIVKATYDRDYEELLEWRRGAIRSAPHRQGSDVRRSYHGRHSFCTGIPERAEWSARSYAHLNDAEAGLLFSLPPFSPAHCPLETVLLLTLFGCDDRLWMALRCSFQSGRASRCRTSGSPPGGFPDALAFTFSLILISRRPWSPQYGSVERNYRPALMHWCRRTLPRSRAP